MATNTTSSFEDSFLGGNGTGLRRFANTLAAHISVSTAGATAACALGGLIGGPAGAVGGAVLGATAGLAAGTFNGLAAWSIASFARRRVRR
jgi:hypothetical protein